MTGGPALDRSVADQRAQFRAWLARRASGAAIDLVETHVSLLGLSDGLAWKLKKSVRFPFVDLSTVARRRDNAAREVALNRRFAPDVYLGIVPLDEDAGDASDVVVEMRRMPDDRRLAVVTRSAEDGADCVDRIANALARIHAGAPRSEEIDRAGSRDAVLGLWNANLDEIATYTGSVLDPALLDRVAQRARTYLAGRAPLFAQRISAGCICDGHGDLLADDVFCLDDGPRFLDGLEFDDRLRYGDVLADVAFLAMDLERLGRPDLAERLLARYAQASARSWPASLADLYVAYRALVRAKVACLRTADDPDAADTARVLLSLAADHLERGRIRMVVVGGPPATGKSTLTRALAAHTGWPVLHSDEVRKELAGLAPTTPAESALDHGIYTPEWDARTYAELLRVAGEHLGGGASVIVDASWSDPDRRRDADRLADATSSAAARFVLDVPDAVAAARARARSAARTDASDATARLAAPLRARFAPWPGAVQLDGTQPIEANVERVLEALGQP